jgi:hypothetical protein
VSVSGDDGDSVRSKVSPPRAFTLIALPAGDREVHARRNDAVETEQLARGRAADDAAREPRLHDRALDDRDHVAARHECPSGR